jgi:hypothetical protein
MPRCKAAEVLRNKAYLEGTSLTKDEGNAADWLFFISLGQSDPWNLIRIIPA